MHGICYLHLIAGTRGTAKLHQLCNCIGTSIDGVAPHGRV